MIPRIELTKQIKFNLTKILGCESASKSQSAMKCRSVKNSKNVLFGRDTKERVYETVSAANCPRKFLSKLRIAK